VELFFGKPEPMEGQENYPKTALSKKWVKIIFGSWKVVSQEAWGLALFMVCPSPEACPVESKALAELVGTGLDGNESLRITTTTAQLFHRGGAILKSCPRQDAPRTSWFSSDRNTLCFDRI
jgi:hypothetical protein